MLIDSVSIDLGYQKVKNLEIITRDYNKDKHLRIVLLTKKLSLNPISYQDSSPNNANSPIVWTSVGQFPHL